MMPVFTKYIALFVLLLVPTFWGFAQDEKSSVSCDKVYEVVLIEPSPSNNGAETTFFEPNLLTAFYAEHLCSPVWYNNSWYFDRAVLMLIELQNYVPYQYNTDVIERRYSELEVFYVPQQLFDFTELDELDVLLTNAAINYAYDLWQLNNFVADEKMLFSVIGEEVIKAINTNTISDLFQNLRAGNLQKIALALVKKQKEKAIKPIVVADTSVVIADLPPEIIAEEQQTSPTVTTKPIIKANIEDFVIGAIKDSVLCALINRITVNKVNNLFDEPIYRIQELADFYATNGCKAVWHNGETTYGVVEQLLKNIEEAYSDGLDPNAYHYSKLLEMYKQLDKTYTAKNLADADFLPKLELLLTDAALHLGYHLLDGKISPYKIDVGYDVKPTKQNLNEALDRAIDAQNSTLDDFFKEIRPAHPMYGRLRNALMKAQYEATNLAAWPLVPGGEKLDLKVSSQKVLDLRKRLNVLPDSLKNKTIPTLIALNDTSLSDSLKNIQAWAYKVYLFDSTVYQAVIDFQTVHGLDADGVVGSQTIAALNTTREERINQLKLNLERWRWLPNDMGNRYVFINIPAFTFYMMEANNVLVLQKKVVTGQPYTPTPVFSDKMEYIEFNPYWTVPFSIASKEILPKLKSNANYLSRNNMELLLGGRSVNPKGINWAGVTSRTFKYRIRQKPGDTNALGRMKFMFPNKYSVYLHDTQSKSLFGETQRAFSHGCIRLHEPQELAEYLLQPDYNKDDIEKILKKKKNERVYLKEHIPVFILYFTAWVDEAGVLQYAPDIYHRDTLFELN